MNNTVWTEDQKARMFHNAARKAGASEWEAGFLADVMGGGGVPDSVLSAQQRRIVRQLMRRGLVSRQRKDGLCYEVEFFWSDADL